MSPSRRSTREARSLDADDRDADADAREADADARDATADRRAASADVREVVADARGVEADLREVVADARTVAAMPVKRTPWHGNRPPMREVPLPTFASYSLTCGRRMLSTKLATSRS